MAPKSSTDPLLSAGELAQIFGISDVDLAKLARRWVIPRVAHPSDKRAHLYPLAECAKAYVAYLKSGTVRAQERLTRARAKAQELKTRREKLEYEVAAGELVRREMILSMAEPILTRYRQAVLSRPERLERRLNQAETREARIEVLKEDSVDSLRALAELFNERLNGSNGHSNTSEAEYAEAGNG